MSPETIVTLSVGALTILGSVLGSLWQVYQNVDKRFDDLRKLVSDLIQAQELQKANVQSDFKLIRKELCSLEQRIAKYEQKIDNDSGQLGSQIERLFEMVDRALNPNQIPTKPNF